MKRFCLVCTVFFLICFNSTKAVAGVSITDDESLIAIDSDVGGVNIKLFLLKDAIKTSVRKHFRGGTMGRQEEQKKMIEQMISHVASSLGVKPVGFSWPSESKEHSVLSIRESSVSFSLNIYPVLCALKIYFDKGLITPGMERRIEESLANGFLSALDRYSSYWNKIDAEIRMGDRGGYTKSIGVTFCIYGGEIIVGDTLPNSPAEKAGLLFRDRIIEVNGVNTEHDAFQDLSRKLWGEVGTIVHLRIKRPGFSRPISFSVVRTRMEIQSVFHSVSERNEKKFGILKITNFNANTEEQYDRYLGSIVGSRPSYIVIDLRDNRGGYIHIVQKIVGRVLGKGRVTLIEEYPSGKRVVRYSDSPFNGGLRGCFKNSEIKMICLVNRNTASGGEAMASALRDAGIKLVGERTYGKGIALVPTKASSGDGYYYTAEFKWLTSRGVCIEGVGLVPDVHVGNSPGGKVDTVLERAIEEIIR